MALTGGGKGGQLKGYSSALQPSGFLENWKHPITDPPSTPAISNLTPGLLNNLDVAIDQNGVGANESGGSQLARAIEKVFTPNKFERVGTLYGILLRQNSPYSEDDPYTPLDVLNTATFAMCGASKYRMPTYKIRIPELHFMLPIPKNPLAPNETDQIIIDCYPTIQAIDTLVAKKAVRPGDIVKVEMANRGAISRLYYVGPVDPDGTVNPWVVGPHSPPYDYGQLLEECKKKYSNAGSRGDIIGKGQSAIKENASVPLVVKGMGIGQNKIITGRIYKEWLFKLFQSLKAVDKYTGLVWLGVCQNNGPEDQEQMLSNDGLKVATGPPGRSTVIYMPASTDPSSPLEIIYWFHDALEFKNNTDEWDRLWDSLKEMSKKQKTLDGARRNFVFVVPEMLWSEEGSGKYHTRQGRFDPRVTGQALDQKNTGLAATYRAREWAAWGFDGIPELSAKEKTGEKPLAFWVMPWRRIPYAFSPLPGWRANPDSGEHLHLPAPVAGNMVELHKEILGILKNKFGVATATKKHVTLVGYKKGGVAIGNLARMNSLKSKAPSAQPQLYASKIVFIHSDYAGTHHQYYGVTAKAQGRNWYHGGDLYDVARRIDDTTRLEIHVAWGENLAIRPRQTAGAFLGALGDLHRTHPHAGHTPLMSYMRDFYGYIWPAHWDPEWFLAGSNTPIGEVQYSESRYKSTYANGLRSISGKRNSMMQMPYPLSHIVYKGWPSDNAHQALNWTPQNMAGPAATVMEMTQDKYEKKFSIDPAIPADIKNTFKDFNGNLILYRSEMVGPTKTVAILEPYGMSAKEDYELIYYLHGDIGLNGAAKTFQSALKNQFNLLVQQKRNAIIIIPDIDPNPINPQSELWGLGSDPTGTPPTYIFSEFHQEVLDKMAEVWQPGWLEYFGPVPPSPPTKFGDDPTFTSAEGGTPEQKAHFAQKIPSAALVKPPSFIAIKAHGGGSRMLKHIVDDMSDNRIETQLKSNIGALTDHGGKNFESETFTLTTTQSPLQRIDFLDGNWGPEYGIFKEIYNTWTADNSVLVPGENFEIQMVVTPRIFGPQKISAIKRAEKYMPGEPDAKPGLWVEQAYVSHGVLPFKFFASPSKLNMSFPTTPSALPLPDDASSGAPVGAGSSTKPPVPLKFDSQGQAYALDGKKMPAYNLKKEGVFIKGALKNHTPSTEQIGGTMGCEVGSRKISGITKSAFMAPVGEGPHKCKVNPLGLLEYTTSQFTSIKISPARSGYSWGSVGLSEYLSGIDNILWTRTSPPTSWIVKDISPQGANGVDKVRGHDSHREGIDVDVLLPQLNIKTDTPTPMGTPNEKKKVVAIKELDIDKTLVFLILSKFYGAKVVFLDKKYFKRIRDQATFLATDGNPTGPSDRVLKVEKAFKSFLKENLFGKLDFVNQIMGMLKHRKHHENHFQVRIEREWGSHETSDYPKWAINRLKNMGCDYKSSSII